LKLIVERKEDVTIVDLGKAVEINILRDRMIVDFGSRTTTIEFGKNLNQEQRNSLAEEIVSRMSTGAPFYLEEFLDDLEDDADGD